MKRKNRLSQVSELLGSVLMAALLPGAAMCFDPSAGDLSKAQANHVRLMSYNTHGDFIAMSSHDAGFGRIFQAINPDIIVMPETNTSVTDSTLRNRMQSLIPNGTGGWYLYRGMATYDIETSIMSRFPLSLERQDTVPAASTRGVTMALVDLPDAVYTRDLYLLGAHLKCCFGYSEEESRQYSADAMMAWMGDARTAGGLLNLAPRTPMVALGDFNLVGGSGDFHPELTLITGDIYHEGTYGSDISGDWDGSPMLDVQPADPTTLDTDTWPSDTTSPSSRLDRFFVTDSVVRVANSFVLNTQTLSTSALNAAGLQKYDTDIDSASDHLPIVMDLAVRGTSGTIEFSQNPIPCIGDVTLTLIDPDEAKQASVTVNVRTSDVQSVDIPLSRTAVNSGVFRGTLHVVASAQAGAIVGSNGMTVTVVYEDLYDENGGASDITKSAVVTCGGGESWVVR